MKNYIYSGLFTTFFFVFVVSSFSQTFNNDLLLVSVSTGASNGSSDEPKSDLPTVRLTVEKGVKGLLGGHILVGAELGSYFLSEKATAKFPTLDYYSATNIIGAGRASWYFCAGNIGTKMDLNTGKLELKSIHAYLGTSAGVRYNIQQMGTDTESKNHGKANFYYNSFAGINYFFNKRIAVFAEIGLACDWFHFGLSFNL